MSIANSINSNTEDFFLNTSNLILFLEKKYEVETWRINDVYMWPVIRNKLALYALSKQTDVNTIETPTCQPHFDTTHQKKTFIIEQLKRFYKSFSFRVKNFYTRIKNLKHDFKFLELYFLKKTDVVFAAGNAHRDYFKGKYLNKFFDPLIIQEPTKYKNSYIFEYDNIDSKMNRFKFVKCINDYNYKLQFVKKKSKKKRVMFN